MKTKSLIFSLLAIVTFSAAILGLNYYQHHCQQELREVDRYALPKAIEFMKAIDAWKLDAVKSFFTDKYISSLTEQEWEEEFEKLAILGELESFARPHFVSHKAYQKYFFCEYAIDVYSISSEFEKDNAVIRIFFENNCGKLKIASFLVTSQSIQIEPEYLSDIKENNSDDEEYIEEISNEELEGDLDSMYEKHQEDRQIPEHEEKINKKLPQKSESKKSSYGKAYRN